MNYIELQTDLQNKINKKISRSKISEILGTSRQNLNTKFNNPKSEVSISDLQKIEKYYGITIYKSGNNSGERQNDTTVNEKSSQFGKRLSELQAKHNLLDREMATLLKISEIDYIKLVTGKLKPNLDILNRLKQNFKVSIDTLLYGE